MKISHIMCISETLKDLCARRIKSKIKNTFCKYCLQIFGNERVFIEHKISRLEINGRQSAKLRRVSIKFKNHFKQLDVPFNIYADFESVLKGVKSSDWNNNTSHTEKYEDHIPYSFNYKVVCIDDIFSKPVVL